MAAAVPVKIILKFQNFVEIQSKEVGKLK